MIQANVESSVYQDGAVPHFYMHTTDWLNHHLKHTWKSWICFGKRLCVRMPVIIQQLTLSTRDMNCHKLLIYVVTALQNQKSTCQHHLMLIFEFWHVCI